MHRKSQECTPKGKKEVLRHCFDDTISMVVLTLAAKAIKPISTATGEMTSTIRLTEAAVKTWAAGTAVVCNA